ncbi:MAG TPA: glycosyltransferase [Gemmatimonadales bacterium]|nr:glycosyltransferase [Gemmatimonadales bacterium]
MSWWAPVLDALNAQVLAYFVVLNAVYVGTTLVALASLRRYAARLRSVDMVDALTVGGTPPVTVVAPAYNEEATCVQSVRALLTLEYAEYEVLVVNDGSKDRTLARLTEAFDLVAAPRAPTSDVGHRPVRSVYRSRTHQGLWVIDKENGGKADALNAGLAHVRTPLFCAIDVDSLVERDALTRIVRPFLEDDSTVAAGGIIRIANGCTVAGGRVTRVELPGSFLARVQVVEYLRSFLSGRVGWDAMGATLIISGAFGMFKRSLVVAAGGYDTTTVGEDMELVVRLHRHCRRQGIPCRISFVADPVAWTECPETLKVLARQRERWHRGLTEVLWRHRGMCFNPRYGRIGMLAVPYYVLLEMLGPIIELAGYAAFVVTILLGRADPRFVAAFLLLAFALGISLSLAAISLEELAFRRYPRTRQMLGLMLVSVLEGIGYHQLHTWWRFKGLVAAVRRRRGWGEMTRKGFGTAPIT